MRSVFGGVFVVDVFVIGGVNCYIIRVIRDILVSEFDFNCVFVCYDWVVCYLVGIISIFIIVYFYFSGVVYRKGKSIWVGF